MDLGWYLVGERNFKVDNQVSPLLRILGKGKPVALECLDSGGLDEIIAAVHLESIPLESRHIDEASTDYKLQTKYNV